MVGIPHSTVFPTAQDPPLGAVYTPRALTRADIYRQKHTRPFARLNARRRAGSGTLTPPGVIDSQPSDVLFKAVQKLQVPTFESSPRADVAGRAIPGADVAGAIPVPVPVWQGGVGSYCAGNVRAKSLRFAGNLRLAFACL
jgi:hypothetical protein